jgi:hypothetical protein
MLIGRQLPDGEGRNVGGHNWLKGDDWPERRPATTVAGDPRVFQPGGHHQEGEQSHNAIRVSEQEAAVLQGFPPDYPWQGTRSKRYQQIGNAVPPPYWRAPCCPSWFPEPATAKAASVTDLVLSSLPAARPLVARTSWTGMRTLEAMSHDRLGASEVLRLCTIRHFDPSSWIATLYAIDALPVMGTVA